MDYFPFVTGYHEDHHAQPGYPFHQIARKAVRSYARSPVRRLLAAGRGQTTPPGCAPAPHEGDRAGGVS